MLSSARYGTESALSYPINLYLFLWCRPRFVLERWILPHFVEWGEDASGIIDQHSFGLKCHELGICDRIKTHWKKFYNKNASDAPLLKLALRVRPLPCVRASSSAAAVCVAATDAAISALNNNK
jgi:hypothetical protein